MRTRLRRRSYNAIRRSTPVPSIRGELSHPSASGASNFPESPVQRKAISLFEVTARYESTRDPWLTSACAPCSLASLSLMKTLEDAFARLWCSCACRCLRSGEESANFATDSGTTRGVSSRSDQGRRCLFVKKSRAPNPVEMKRDRAGRMGLRNRRKSAVTHPMTTRECPACLLCTESWRWASYFPVYGLRRVCRIFDRFLCFWIRYRGNEPRDETSRVIDAKILSMSF